MFTRIIQFITSLAALAMLASCGGGTQVAEGGIGGTGISTGSITAFGSVWVNDVEFSTVGAKIIEEDDEESAIILNTNDPAEISQYLNEGMVVTVKGTINDDGVTGTAETISFEDILEGPVVGTPGLTSFVVLGYTIHVVNGVTRYSCDDSYVTCDLTDISDLSEKQVVEISGFIDENGEIRAGYIEKQDETYTEGVDQFEVKGTASVSNSTTFTIGGLTIITADTTGLDGQFVEAEGTFNGIDTLTATEVEIENESFDIDDADKAELEGIASTGCAATSCDFTLAGVTVRVDSNTQYSGNGTSATDINAGVKLEAEGSLQGGILFADEIEFE